MRLWKFVTEISITRNIKIDRRRSCIALLQKTAKTAIQCHPETEAISVQLY